MRRQRPPRGEPRKGCARRMKRWVRWTHSPPAFAKHCTRCPRRSARRAAAPARASFRRMAAQAQSRRRYKASHWHSRQRPSRLAARPSPAPMPAATGSARLGPPSPKSARGSLPGGGRPGRYAAPRSSAPDGCCAPEPAPPTQADARHLVRTAPAAAPRWMPSPPTRGRTWTGYTHSARACAVGTGAKLLRRPASPVRRVNPAARAVIARRGGAPKALPRQASAAPAETALLGSAA
jgi:hypothetical protein